MTDDLDFRHFLGTLRRNILFVVFTAILVAGAAYLTAKLQSPKYRATETLLFAPADSAINPVDHARAISTLTALAKTDRVIGDAAQRVHIPTADLKKAISVSGTDTEDLIRISATARRATTAANYARAVGESFIAWRKSIQQDVIRARITSLRDQLTQLIGQTNPSAVAAAGDLRAQLAEAQSELANSNGDLREAAPATPPSSPFTPHPLRDLSIGLLAGLLLGAGLAFVRERLDRRLRSLEQVEQAYGLPMLGVVPFVRAAARGRRPAALANFDSTSALADSFRNIRTNLQLITLDNADERARVIVVSSAVPGEGKSAVAANLAGALASSGRNVLALSADLRSPTLHEYFGRRHDDGLIQVLAGERQLQDAARYVSMNGAAPSEHSELALLGSAERIFDPAVLFQSKAMANMLNEARGYYDFIIIDAPPLLAAADATVLAQQGDTLLLVARLGGVTRQDAARTLRVLHMAEVSPVGVVAIGHPDPDEGYGYGYGYGRTNDGN
jgi:capsular exopolysaccharide synthesis family protein